MSRAYIKLDPSFPDRKDYYPDGPWRALVTLFCYASHQPTPGVFKSERLAKVMLGRHARHLSFLIDEKDVVKGRDGSLTVVGWKDWQEGTFTSVAARMEAIEKRRRPLSPADRAFLYRKRKRDAESDASRDGQRDAQSDVTLRNSDSTNSPPTRQRIETDENGKFVVVQGTAA